MVEIWQADHQGRYAHPADGRPLASNSFRGFGRCPTDKDGGFAFATIKPGARARPRRHARRRRTSTSASSRAGS